MHVCGVHVAGEWGWCYNVGGWQEVRMIVREWDRTKEKRDRWETVHGSQKPQVRQMFILYSVDNRHKC